MSTAATPEEVRLLPPVVGCEGYNRRFIAGNIVGRLVFGLTSGDRSSRSFVINARFNTHGETEEPTTIACLGAKASRVLVEVMNNDESAAILASQATDELLEELAAAQAATV
jgi:hypothetical protein